MNISLDSLHKYKRVMVVQISVLEEQVMVLESEKLQIREQLDLMIEKSRKINGEVTTLQVELESNLNTVKTILS